MTFAHIFESLSRPLGGHRLGGWQCEGGSAKKYCGGPQCGGSKILGGGLKIFLESSSRCINFVRI